MTHTPYNFVSVIIPVRNAAKTLPELLNALLRQSYPADRFEVIVVDDNSEDETVELLEKSRNEFQQAGTGLKLLKNMDRLGPYTSRNRGMELAEGEAYAFLDANKIPDQDWLEEGIRSLSSIGEEGTYRDQDMDENEGQKSEGEEPKESPYTNNTVPGLAGGEILFDLPEQPGIGEVVDALSFNNNRNLVLNERSSAAGNLFVDKRVAEEIGPFPSGFRSGMDIHWTRRAVQAGFPLVFADKAVVRCKPRKLGATFRKAVRTGRVHPLNMQQEGNSAWSIFSHTLKTFLFPRPSQLKAGLMQFEQRQKAQMRQKIEVQSKSEKEQPEPEKEQAESSKGQPEPAKGQAEPTKDPPDKQTKPAEEQDGRPTEPETLASTGVSAPSFFPLWMGVWLMRIGMGFGRLEGLLQMRRMKSQLDQWNGAWTADSPPENDASSVEDPQPSAAESADDATASANPADTAADSAASGSKTKKTTESPLEQAASPPAQAGSPTTTKKPTIAYFYYNFYPVTGGASVHGYHLAKELSHLGYNLIKINGDPDPWTEKKSRTPLGLVSALRQSDLAYIRVDFFFNFRNMIALLALLAGKKVVIELNCPSDELHLFGKSRRQILRRDRFWRKFLRRADRVIVVSEAVRDYCEVALELENVTLIENGGEVFDQDKITPGTEIQKQYEEIRSRYNKVAIWAGSINRMQQADWLKEIIEQDDGETAFVIITRQGQSGERSEQKADREQHRFKTLAEFSNVYPFADLDRKDVGWLIAGADIGLAFYDQYDWSRWGFYNSPLKIFEFLNNGLWTITNIHGTEVMRSSDRFIRVRTPEEAVEVLRNKPAPSGRKNRADATLAGMADKNRAGSPSTNSPASKPEPVRTWQQVANQTAKVFDEVIEKDN